MQNNLSSITPKAFLKTFSIIHVALVIGVSLFGIVAYTLTENQKFSLDYSGDAMFFVVPLIAIAGIVVVNFLYRNTIKGLASKDTLMGKLIGIQTASIIKYALLEGPALFGIVAFMNEGNQYFLGISIFLIGWLIMQRPTRDKIERDLMLSGRLKSEFQQEDKPMT
ncbi:hypothetical protein O4H26_06865 [Aequorivita viscosa]|nr:hypothetical protein [Aequorivita viscosa]